MLPSNRMLHPGLEDRRRVKNETERPEGKKSERKSAGRRDSTHPLKERDPNSPPIQKRLLRRLSIQHQHKLLFSRRPTTLLLHPQGQPLFQLLTRFPFHHPWQPLTLHLLLKRHVQKLLIPPKRMAVLPSYAHGDSIAEGVDFRVCIAVGVDEV